MAKRQRANLLWQGKGVRTHHRAERTAAAAELRHPGRAVTRTAGALLLVHLLAGAPDLGAALGLVGAGLTLVELPLNAALDDILARLQTEDAFGELDRTGRLAFKGCDFQFHLCALRLGRCFLGRRFSRRLSAIGDLELAGLR